MSTKIAKDLKSIHTKIKLMGKVNCVCIIDDDDVTQFTTRKTIQIIKRADTVLSFTNGKEAIDFFADNVQDEMKLPEVIFLDLNMPIMDGWLFLEKYVALKPSITKHISINIISSSNDVADTRRAKHFPDIVDYIVKPLTIEKLNYAFDAFERTY